MNSGHHWDISSCLERRGEERRGNMGREGQQSLNEDMSGGHSDQHYMTPINKMEYFLDTYILLESVKR